MKKDKATRKAELKAAAVQKLKSLIAPLIALLIIGIAVAAIMLWPEEVEEEKIIELRGYSGEESEYVMENEQLKFTMDPETTQFSVTVKDTGAVWYSNPQDADSDGLAFTTEKSKLKSTVLLTYTTINGVDTLYNNYDFSMTNKLYEIEQGEDYIRVDYSIGDVEREFIIPLVIEEDRYNALMDGLSGGNKNLVSQYYKKYDVNKLSKSDEKIKDELLERYPLLETTVIYAIRDTANEAVKTKLEGLFAESGYTYEDYLADKEKDTALKTSDKPVYNMSMIYRLEDGDLVVEVPLDSLDYVEDKPIYYLSLLPYFGAAGTSEEGFLFVPEGGGALINFNNGKVAQNPYYASIYGWDMCQDREAIVHETRTSFNVFGEAKGNDSYICIVEQGAPYAAVQADIAGRNNSYNFINAVYTVTKREQYDVSDKYNGSMYVYEPTLPEGESYAQRYRFVNSGDYTDMAKAYQEYLFNTYEGAFAKQDSTEAPVLVEIVGAVDKVKQVFGVPVSRPLALTTYKEAEAMIAELKANGMNELSVKLTGWANGGVQQKMLEKIKTVKDLGSRKELQQLITSANNLGVPVYLDGITNYAIDSDFFDGFFVFTDAARFVSKEKAELYEYSSTTYGKRDDLDEYYLLNAELIDEMVANLTEEALDMNAGVSFADIGKELSSDFTRKAPVSRQAVKEKHTETLQQLSGTMNIMINDGNDYAVAYADMVSNMDLRGAEYTIIDRTVPFYQMALHGYVEYTGEPLNLTKELQDELLKSAEYGAGLSFTLMEESSFTLQNTLYTEYFGAEYAAAKDNMYEIYNRYNKELGHVFGQEMTDHEYLAADVTCTTYEDGTKVYVNYTYQDFTAADGTVVPAKDYTVKR
ncbi:MAG: hypothetical protein J6K04_11450 [Lachnospiraceae bacterium]|nr:hypothetical protein [Lachnospiraceae bacterium]